MDALAEIDSFGGIDADADKLLDICFEDHEAYLSAKEHSRFLIIGRKGSGKTAIYRKLISIPRDSYRTFSYGHDFSDYPWQHHDRQESFGVPEEERFLHSWEYLILMTFSKVLLNQDNSQPWSDNATEYLSKMERFVLDSYGSRNPDVAQIFSPARALKFESSFDIPLGSLKLALSKGVPVEQLPAIVQEVNRTLLHAVIESLNPDFDYYVCFDQLDRGFEPTAKYKNRLIGLLLAARDVSIAAQRAGKRASVVVFLRDDIYQILSFEDKNKITENFVARIEWDTSRSSKTLKQLMAKRFAVVLKIPEAGAWEKVFDEDEKMTGKQSKYQHMLDRTFLRPRDMIKFSNEVLGAYKLRSDGLGKFNNRDVQSARMEYSRYLLNELDDELHKHLPDYKTYVEVLKSMDSLAFTLDEFEQACRERSFLIVNANAVQILKDLFEFSIVGYYSPGGAGYGGSEYIWRYRDPRAQFNEAASQYRMHPGLKEVLGVRKYTKSE